MTAPAAARIATRIPSEYRFPLHLEPSVATVWDLYNEAKRSAWDPFADIPWFMFRPGDYGPAALGAARRVWSHRVWTLYGRLSETPALLVRFCLERQRESDPKYFLSIRGSQDAWHVDTAGRMAMLCGGLVAAPADPGYAASFNLALHRETLSADETLDSFVAAYCAYRDGLDAALLGSAERIAGDPVAAAVLGRMHADRARQAEFGWRYLGERAGEWAVADRAAIFARIARCEAQFVASGVLLPAFGADADGIAAAYAAAADAGLGGLAAADAMQVRDAFTAAARARFAALGVVW